MFDTVKNTLGSNWPERTPTLNIEWGQIDPKVTGGLITKDGLNAEKNFPTVGSIMCAILLILLFHVIIGPVPSLVVLYICIDTSTQQKDTQLHSAHLSR